MPSPFRRSFQATATFALGCAVAMLAATHAQAEFYKWVGPDGTVHFTADPPPNVNAERVEPKKSASRVQLEATGGSSTTSRYAGARPSRMIVLEKAGLGMDDKRNETFGDCNGHPKTYVALLRSANQMKWIPRFHYELAELNYSTPARAASFAGERPPPLELSAIAKIKAVRLDDCAKNSSMIVEWSFYDHVEQRRVLDLETRGVFLTSRPGYPADRAVLETMFRDAARNLAGDAGFRALVDPNRTAAAIALEPSGGESGGSPAALASGGGSESAPTFSRLSMPLDLVSAADGGRFSDRVARLKAASATIRTLTGHGSGFLISSNGYVLTNHHVVDGADRVIVVFEDHQIEADVIREHPDRDVALLKLRRRPRVAPLSISRTKPGVGQPLYVIGTPLTETLHHSVTAGVLSASRQREGKPFYQTDAAVKPGNSGGPVFDAHGNIVGLTVSGLFTKSGASLDVNLVIPIESAFEALAIAPR